jgi:hypothetical protein
MENKVMLEVEKKKMKKAKVVKIIIIIKVMKEKKKKKIKFLKGNNCFKGKNLFFINFFIFIM